MTFTSNIPSAGNRVKKKLNKIGLQKLTIEGYSNSLRVSKYFERRFVAMFNPETFSFSYDTVRSIKQAYNSSSRQSDYIMTTPGQYTFTLILDGTDVTNYGLATLASTGLASTPGVGGAIEQVASTSPFPVSQIFASKTIDPSKTVPQRLEDLRSVAVDYHGEPHQPYWLKLRWGEWDISVVCKKIDTKFTLIDRNGEPIRAEVTLTFLEDEAPKKRRSRENKKSPDMTRFLRIKNHDSLPNLANDAYGDAASYYIQVAEANGYDNFRRLSVGSTIQLPSLET